MRPSLPRFARRFALLFVALGFALPAQSRAGQVQSGSTFHPSSWTTEEHMQCGASRVSIATHCSEQIEDLPYCDTQTLSVSTGGQVRETAYRLPFKDGNQPMIVSAACYAKDKQGFIVLGRTNFGNCMGCEWEDVFSSSGEYLGSGQGMNEGESLVHRPIPPHVRAALHAMESSPQAQTAEIPLISRAHPRR